MTMQCQFPNLMKPWQFCPRPVLIHFSQLFFFKVPHFEVLCIPMYTTVLQPIVVFYINQMLPFHGRNILHYCMWCMIQFAISQSTAFLCCWICVLAPSRIFSHVMSKFMFKWTEKEPCFTEWLQDSTGEVVIASMQFLRNRQKWSPNVASFST